MTRKDYMDGKISHQQYYEALAAEAGVSFAKSDLLPRIKKALADGDEHLNSIPLATWDNFAFAAQHATSPVLKAHGDSWSIAGGVCIAKAAATKAARDS